MSKRIEAKITCPKCGCNFDFTLYRSIWGEYPENRELIFSDKINVAKCPSCYIPTKLPYPFIYTNANLKFAVWWEPEYDPQIDKDSEGYSKMLGEGNYLAAAPRIKNWEDFKRTILKFENGELKGKDATVSKEMHEQMQGFLKHLQNTNKQTSKNSGCLGLFIFLIASFSILTYYVLNA